MAWSEADFERVADFLDKAALAEGGDVGELAGADAEAFGGVGSDEHVEGEGEGLACVAEAFVEEDGASASDTDSKVGPCGLRDAVNILGVVIEDKERLRVLVVGAGETAEELEFGGEEVLGFIDIDGVEKERIASGGGQGVEAFGDECRAVVALFKGIVGAE